jgi:VWFA-related protein
MIHAHRSRRPWAVAVLPAVALFAAALGAQSQPQTQTQTQATPPVPSPQTGAAPQQPQFRTEVDVIRLDVSVLDKDRRPVRGLTMEDFTVTEDGTAQRLVAVTEIDAIDQDPAPSAWMRYAPNPVVTNDLADQAGNGRVYAIVIDDWNLPWDDTDIAIRTRETARYIVNGLGPSDLAAVVYAQDSGLTEDFTNDRNKLLAAIDKYNPHERPWIYQTPRGPGPGGGDMPQRFTPTLMRSTCQRSQPTVPTLLTVVQRMATVPERRKTLVLVSTGLPVSPGATRGCPGELADLTRDMFRLAQRANINMHTIDPAGYRGYEDYLQRPKLRGREMGTGMTLPQATQAARIRREYLEIMAEETGARSVVRTDAVEPGVDRIFEEDTAYYLIGYQTTNGKPDCKFRKVQVKVNRPDVEVRTRSGYYSACENSLESRETKQMPMTSDLGLVGLMAPSGLPLRAVATAFGPGSTRGQVDVGIVLTVRLPAEAAGRDEVLTVTRNLYDEAGRAGPPEQRKWPLSLPRAGGDELRYDVYYRVSLAPGRYEMRLNATSAALERTGSVFAPIEVPDFSLGSIVMSGLALGLRPPAGVDRSDPFAARLPIVPTTARDFEPNVPLAVSFRVQVGASAPPGPIVIETKLVDAADKVAFERQQSLAVDELDPLRGAQITTDLPLMGLARGPYLVSVSATRPDGRSTRRDLVIRVR